MWQFFCDLDTSINFISNIANIVTLGLAIYGVVYWLPSFERQKRIENLSAEARKALEILTEKVEIDLKILFFVCRFKIEGGEQRYSKIVALDGSLIRALIELQNTLLFLPQDQILQESGVISNLISILEKEFYPLDPMDVNTHCMTVIPGSNAIAPGTKAVDILKEIDENWRSNEKLNFEKIEKLKRKLKDIYIIFPR